MTGTMLQAHRARQSYAAIDTGTRAEQASPHRLIELLYDELLSCLRQAAFAVEGGQLELKSQRVSKALSILHGLETGLDSARGGEVAASLADVYAGVRGRIMAGNAGNDIEALNEAIDAIAGIAEAWVAIRP